MIELVIEGITYNVGKMPLKAQFHVARRLAPIIAKIGALAPTPVQPPVPVQAVNGEDSGEGSTDDPQATGVDESKFFIAIADGLASLSDKDCDYVIAACMQAVMRRHGEHSVPVWNKGADQPQFADMDLNTLMQLTIAVIQDNLGGFMPAQRLAGQAASTTTRSAL